MHVNKEQNVKDIYAVLISSTFRFVRQWIQFPKFSIFIGKSVRGFHRFLSCILAVICIVFFSSWLLGRDFPQIEKLRVALNRIKPFKVQFIQEVFTEEAEQPDIRESGEIIFKNDHSLKWTYLDPDYKVFLLTDNNYQFYDEDNEQLITGKIQDKSRQWVWQILFSEDLVQQSNVVWNESRHTLHLTHTPDKKSGDSSQWNDANVDIEITVNSRFLPVKVMQKDPSGVIVLYYFNQYSPQVTIHNDTFQLTVPEGVEIIREES